jgi:hypothetical protein
MNTFRLNLSDATWSDRARYEKGSVHKSPAYLRDGKILPLDGPFEPIVEILQRESRIQGIVEHMKTACRPFKEDAAMYNHLMISLLRALEATVLDGWVTASLDPSLPVMNLKGDYHAIHWNEYAKDE